MSRFLVTGTGRCGTLYAAEVLRACGLRVGHQDVIRHEHVLGDVEIDWRDYDGEISFEAAPVVRSPMIHPVVLIYRDPLLVAASWLSLGAFQDGWEGPFGLLARSVHRFAPSVFSEQTPVDRAVRFWAEWNGLAMVGATSVLSIEGLAPRRLLEAVDRSDRYRPLAEMVPRNTNHRTDAKFGYRSLTWAEVGRSARAAAMDALLELGRRNS